jgi:Ran GTPase-activating protein 1
MIAEPRGTVGTEVAFSNQLIGLKKPSNIDPSTMINFVIPCQGKFFDKVDKDLEQYFEFLDHERVASFELSGNSFGLEACGWIAENVLINCVNLQEVNFSDIFTTRERKDLPPSLKVMVDAILDKPIKSINLSHNAFGPDGVNAYTHFLETCPALEILNVTNCGLGPEGGKLLAKAMLKNYNMKLIEFYGSRGRL